MGLGRWLIGCGGVGTCVAVLACSPARFPSQRRGEASATLQDRSAMVVVPAGRFSMGNAQGEPDEYPPHEVELPGFLLDRTEVTQADHARCVAAGACRPSAYADEPVLGLPTHPVVGVSLFDAQRYCRWVGKRLPTEAEWEYAARYPDGGRFPWRGPFSPQRANARGDADGYPWTAPVGSFPEGASALGLLDMAGNVSEWTQDIYDGHYYERSPPRAPGGPSEDTGAHALRGGSWADSDHALRTTARASLPRHASTNAVGFRCAAGGEAEGG